MGTKEPGKSYESLPKRELQDLCKKYGLSPYNRRSNLVNLLNSYFEKKNSSPITPPERSSAHSTSLLPQLQSGAQLGDIADARKDNFGNVTCPGEEDSKRIHSQTGKSNELACHKGVDGYDKESPIQISEKLPCSMYDIRRSPRLNSQKREISRLQNVFQCDENGSKCSVEPPKVSLDKKNLAFSREAGVGSMPQVQHQNENNGSCPAENASSPSMKPPNSIPYFEFYVRSEQGINLLVDLNSSTSDWCKKLENQVCINQDLRNNKFQSFRQELESLGNSCNQTKNSLLKNTNPETGVNSVPVRNDSSPNSVENENGHVGFDQTNEADGSLGFSAVKPGSIAVEMSAHSNERKEVPPLSRLSSDLSNQIVSYTESCPVDMETKAIDSNVLNNPHVILACNSVVNLKSVGLESLNTLEDQNSKPYNENFGYIVPQRNCGLENPSAVYSGCSAIGSMEFQMPEVGSPPKDASNSHFENNYSLNFVDTMNNAERGDGLANSSEANLDTCGNKTPAFTEEWESGNPVSGTEASDPLQNSVEDLAPNVRRKRKRDDSEIVCSGDQQDRRVLRSGKHLGGRVLPRRSMRLVK